MAHQYAQCPCGPNTSLNTRDDAVCGQPKPARQEDSRGRPANANCCKISPITPVKCPRDPAIRPSCPGRQSPTTMCSPKSSIGPTPCRQYKNPSSPGHCRKPSKCSRTADAGNHPPERINCENRNFCAAKNESGSMELTAHGKEFASQTGRTVRNRNLNPPGRDFRLAVRQGVPNYASRECGRSLS